ncbi:MAG: MarR family transcriptional regulator [Bacteroidota bacterium]
MDIEKEIGQQVFRSDRQKGIINMVYTYNWMIEKMKHRLDEFDLTMQQFNILRILRGAQGPLSTLQIRERMLDKMSDTSRIVDRLIIKELAQKNTCPRDKRLVDVLITGKGLELLAKLDLHADELDAIIENLSSAELQQLNYLLDKIRHTPALTES